MVDGLVPLMMSSKARRSIVGVAAIVSGVLVAPAAHALTITTPYRQFTWTQGTTPTRNPSPLSFETFNSLATANAITGATLTGVKFKVASAIDGTGNASVGGRIRVNNAGSNDPATVTGATYDLKLQFSTGQLVGSQQSTSSVICTPGTAVNCTQSGTSVIVSAPDPDNSVTGVTDIALNGAYTGASNSITGAGLSIFNTGATVTTVNSAINNYFVTFAGVTANPDTSFNYNGTTINPKAFMTGFIGLEYEYTVPTPPTPPTPGASVPGPLPILGASAAFAWTRRLRKRIVA
jgi:hypothetical protein